jgi:hypothetical protein
MFAFLVHSAQGADITTEEDRGGIFDKAIFLES